MQVAIGATMAEVSDDGRDVQFPAPAGAGNALVLPFPDISHASRPTSGATLVASKVKPDWHAPVTALDGSASAALILCAVVSVVAVKRFVGRAGLARDEAPSRLHDVLDDAAFLKRYGRTS